MYENRTNQGKQRQYAENHHYQHLYDKIKKIKRKKPKKENQKRKKKTLPKNMPLLPSKADGAGSCCVLGL